MRCYLYKPTSGKFGNGAVTPAELRLYYMAMANPETTIILGETIIPVANDIFNDSMSPSTAIGRQAWCMLKHTEDLP